VTGASRGVGKGVALALGERGAVVYLTGRSVTGMEPTTSLAGMVDETAAEVSARGGPAYAVQCDHRDDSSVENVFARIEREQGRLDVLVNNAGVVTNCCTRVSTNASRVRSGRRRFRSGTGCSRRVFGRITSRAVSLYPSWPTAA